MSVSILSNFGSRLQTDNELNLKNILRISVMNYLVKQRD